jgi:hypothetical protein
MTTAAEYRQYAEECLAAMRAALIPEVRAALSTAAKRWTALAEQTEEEEHASLAAPRRARQRSGDAGAPAQT